MPAKREARVLNRATLTIRGASVGQPCPKEKNGKRRSGRKRGGVLVAVTARKKNEPRAKCSMRSSPDSPTLKDEFFQGGKTTEKNGFNGVKADYGDKQNRSNRCGAQDISPAWWGGKTRTR